MQNYGLKTCFQLSVLAAITATASLAEAAEVIRLGAPTNPLQSQKSSAPMATPNLLDKKQFKEKERVKLGSGITKIKYQQLYQGIPLYNYSIVANAPSSSKGLQSAPAGVSGGLRGNLVQGIGVDLANVKPTLSQVEVNKIAFNTAGISAKKTPQTGIQSDTQRVSGL